MLLSGVIVMVVAPALTVSKSNKVVSVGVGTKPYKFIKDPSSIFVMVKLGFCVLVKLSVLL